MRLLRLAVLASLALACQGPVSPSPSSNVLLQVGQTLPLGGGDYLVFAGVLSDSRCPINAVCVWIGNAEVKFTLREANRTVTTTANTFLEPRYIGTRALRITVADLSPQPRTPGTTDPTVYVVELQVDAIPRE